MTLLFTRFSSSPPYIQSLTVRRKADGSSLRSVSLDLAPKASRLCAIRHGEGSHKFSDLIYTIYLAANALSNSRLGEGLLHLRSLNPCRRLLICLKGRYRGAGRDIFDSKPLWCTHHRSRLVLSPEALLCSNTSSTHIWSL